MGRLARATQLIFGSSATDIGDFGSGAAGSPVSGANPALSAIQSLSQWAGGWLAATLGSSKFPAIEDMNAVDYLVTSQLAYLFQQGIAVEWDSGTTYYHSTTQSVVMQPGTLNLFASLTDNNIGNALPTAPASNTNWQFLGSLSSLASSNLYIGGTTTGSANAQVIASLSPASGFSMSNPGDTITCTAGFTNTGDTTVAVTTPAITAKHLRKNSGSGLIALTGGEIIAGNVMTLTVDASSTYLVLDAGLPATLFLQAANNLSDVGSASTARSNISAAKSGANTDITSLQGGALIVTPLGVGAPIWALNTSGVVVAGATYAASSLTPVVGSWNGASGGIVYTLDTISGTYQAMLSQPNSGNASTAAIPFQRVA